MPHVRHARLRERRAVEAVLDAVATVGSPRRDEAVTIACPGTGAVVRWAERLVGEADLSGAGLAAAVVVGTLAVRAGGTEGLFDALAGAVMRMVGGDVERAREIVLTGRQSRLSVGFRERGTVEVLERTATEALAEAGSAFSIKLAIEGLASARRLGGVVRDVDTLEENSAGDVQDVPVAEPSQTTVAARDAEPTVDAVPEAVVEVPERTVEPAVPRRLLDMGVSALDRPHVDNLMDDLGLAGVVQTGVTDTDTDSDSDSDGTGDTGSSGSSSSGGSGGGAVREAAFGDDVSEVPEDGVRDDEDTGAPEVAPDGDGPDDDDDAVPEVELSPDELAIQEERRAEIARRAEQDWVAWHDRSSAFSKLVMVYYITQGMDPAEAMLRPDEVPMWVRMRANELTEKGFAGMTPSRAAVARALDTSVEALDDALGNFDTILELSAQKHGLSLDL